MSIKENTFAASCFDDNSIEELETALLSPPDQQSLSDWSLTPEEYYAEIECALSLKHVCTEDYGR
jgi:hypothetical protein